MKSVFLSIAIVGAFVANQAQSADAKAAEALAQKSLVVPLPIEKKWRNECVKVHFVLLQLQQLLPLR
jgi:hypothetical protein